MIDAVTSEVRWPVRTVGAPRQVAAVVLRRVGGGVLTGPASGTSGGAPVTAKLTVPDDATRVVARLMGPGMPVASGSLPLSARDREAYASGALRVALYTAGGEIVKRVLRRR